MGEFYFIIFLVQKIVEPDISTLPIVHYFPNVLIAWHTKKLIMSGGAFLVKCRRLKIRGPIWLRTPSGAQGCWSW